MFINKIFFEFKYFSSNSNIIVLFSKFFFELKYFYALWQICILIKIFCLIASSKFRIAKGASQHPALMGSWPTLWLHVLALSTQWMVRCYSVLGDVWGIRWGSHEEGVS